jgi:hypothetical protein
MSDRHMKTRLVKAAISVTEMSRILGLSRGHFWFLAKTTGIFPMPVYHIRTRRPIYTAELQQVCQRVKATHVGLNGEYYAFNSPRKNNLQKPKSRGSAKANGRRTGKFAELTGALRELGLETTDSQIQKAVDQLYPSGFENCDGVVIRAVFQHIRRSISNS